MKKLSIIVLAFLLVITESFAGNVTLFQMPVPNGTQTQANFTVCGSSTWSFFVTYTYSSHSSAYPNRYRTTIKLYKNGSLLTSVTATLSSTYSNQGFYNITVSPGTYTATATLERRPTAGGWYTAETITSNAITVTTVATPNFTIGSAVATDDPNNVPLVTFNATDVITVNASNTSCESNYWVGIWETTSNWWERTYQYEWGGWFPEQAPANINLQSLAATSSQRWINGPVARKNNVLIGGKISNSNDPAFNNLDRYYTVGICTGEPTWTCKRIQIRILCQ